MKNTFAEGDLFFINDIKIGRKILSLENKYRVGKLIFLSSYFEDMIGFIPSISSFSEKPKSLDKIEFMDEVIYTGNSELKNGNWEIIGHENISEKETLLTKRRVANAIMIKDDEIRICTEEDYKKYKNQGIAGLGAVHYLLMNLPK